MILYNNDNIQVIRKNGIRELWLNNACMGRAEEKRLWMPVSKYMIDILEQTREYKSFLFIGLGAGIMPSYLARKECDVTVIEPDNFIIDTAIKYFGLPMNVKVILGKGEDWINKVDVFDCIIIDAYNDYTPVKEIYCDSFYNDAMMHIYRHNGVILSHVVDRDMSSIHKKRWGGFHYESTLEKP